MPVAWPVTEIVQAAVAPPLVQVFDSSGGFPVIDRAWKVPPAGSALIAVEPAALRVPPARTGKVGSPVLAALPTDVASAVVVRGVAFVVDRVGGPDADGVGVVADALVGVAVVVGGIVVLDADDVGDGVAGACGVVLDGDTGPPATVSVVAHGWPAEHVASCGKAAVLSVVPCGASAATVAWNDVVARKLDGPCIPRGGTFQASVLAFAFNVRPCLASSAVGVETVALSSRPERSSRTDAPAERGC